MNTIEFFTKINIIQIGAGGTGSWLVPLVSKLVNNIQLRLSNNQSISYNIIDSDIVEDKNILRQNFTDWDIGKNKAQALINRYVENFANIRAFNIKITSHRRLRDLLNNIFQPILLNSDSNKNLIIFLGCVDNNKTRRIIYSVFKKIVSPTETLIYIDGGNLLYNGQIVNIFKNIDNTPLQDLLPNRKKINFNKMFPVEKEKESITQSCAFFGDQSQCINNLAAALMFASLQKILVNNEIPPAIIEFNASGYSHFQI